MVDIGSSYGSRLDVSDRQGFRPTGESVDHGEEIFEPLGLRERSNQINVDVVESFGRWFKLLQGGLCVCLDL